MKSPSVLLTQWNCKLSGARACSPPLGSSVPDAPVKEPDTEPRPETSPPPTRQPKPSPFDPDWPEDRPEPQPKA